MSSKIRYIKFTILVIFMAGSATVMLVSDRTSQSALARANGAPNSRTGAPTATGTEANCTSCHSQNAGPGQLQIIAPAQYTPGQTMQISVKQTTTDPGVSAWGFQLTALDTTTNSKAGTLTATTSNTAVANSATRQYMNHTSAGNFTGTTGTVTWTFNWTAPATNIGNIKLYAAGLQADNSGDESGDQTYLTNVTLTPAATTDAGVTINGRVMTPEGRGVRNAVVVITDAAGQTRSVRTGPRGNYQFNDVAAGETYVIGVLSRRFQFASRVLFVVDNVADVDFVALQ